jgi:hypothetical protein
MHPSEVQMGCLWLLTTVVLRDSHGDFHYRTNQVIELILEMGEGSFVVVTLMETLLAWKGQGTEVLGLLQCTV